MATWLIGPLLPLNPDFTRFLLDLMGRTDAPLAFEEDVRAAYRERLKTFRLPGMGLAY